MEKSDLKVKVFSTLKEHLSKEEFNRIHSISIGDSDADKRAKLLLRAEEQKAENLRKEQKLLVEKEQLKIEGYIEQLAKDNVKDLAKYLKVDAIAINAFTLNIAMQYRQKGQLTAKQKQAVLRDNVLAAVQYV